MAFKLSRKVVEGVLRLKPDWVRPKHARRDITEGLFNTIVGYAAEKRAGGLGDGKGTTLLASGSLEREFRDTMRKALGFYDALIGHMTIELRDWVLKARGRKREYPWGSLFAEGEWLWVIPKAQPIDTWASPREEKPVLVELKPKKTMLEIQVKGRAGTGKSTLSREIGVMLRGYGFDVIVEDTDAPASEGIHALRLGSIRKHMRMNDGQIVVKAVQTPRKVSTSLLDWGPDGLYDATRATHLTGCHAGGRNSDGECNWRECPQRKDDEPAKTGRHCPLDKHEDEG